MSNPIEYTVKVCPNGDREWYLYDKRHREDGPAIEWASGTRFWYLNGKRHREDGPATEWANGTRLWYLNGKRHREDGPAIEYATGDRFWYLNGKSLSEAEHALAVAKLHNPNAELVERLAKAEAEVAAVRKELGQ